MIGKMLGLMGMVLAGGLGAMAGGWVTNNQNPVQFLSRKVLTPVVRPGDAIKLELDNYRISRCPQRTWRIITKADGERDTKVEDKPAAFGKMGRDVYTVSVPTSPSSPYGKASMYSYTERMCNPWEIWNPVVYGEWTDTFEFGPETKRIPADQAKNTLVPDSASGALNVGGGK